MCTGIYPPDELFMRAALDLAARGLGRTAPNPPVGCVIVQNGHIVGRGFHPKAGEPHAEVFALREAGQHASGATAYVTLEPCNHTGRTPPCTDALIAAGIRRVVVAATDPHPHVSGSGVHRLQAAGMEISLGVLADEALHQQAGFRSLAVRGRPWVVYKYAMTLDGRVADAFGESRWISGEAARSLVHQWRDELDAVAVGSGTVLADDPQLTTRGLSQGRNPRAIIFDRRGRTPQTAQALRLGTVLVTHPATDLGHLKARGAEIVRAHDLPSALKGLGALGLTTLLLEGGGGLAGAFLEADLIDEVRVFVAPTLLGGGLSPLALMSPACLAQARSMTGLRSTLVGSDVLIQGFLHPIPQLGRPMTGLSAF